MNVVLIEITFLFLLGFVLQDIDELAIAIIAHVPVEFFRAVLQGSEPESRISLLFASLQQSSAALIVHLKDISSNLNRSHFFTLWLDCKVLCQNVQFKVVFVLFRPHKFKHLGLATKEVGRSMGLLSNSVLSPSYSFVVHPFVG